MAVDVSSVSIRGTSSSGPSNNLAVTNRILRELGNVPGVLDTVAMKSMGLQSAFKGFQASSVSPQELGLVSKNLFALGLIDRTTANLFISAGTSLDNVGNQTRQNVKMNSLDYFAARIDSLRKANVNGNEYGFHVVPDYVKAIHVLQNLSDFAKPDFDVRSAVKNASASSSSSSIDVWT